MKRKRLFFLAYSLEIHVQKWVTLLEGGHGRAIEMSNPMVRQGTEQEARPNATPITKPLVITTF